ncbi:MAG: hypothetical protein U0176_16440 [Bacteroidia bacterium]
MQPHPSYSIVVTSRNDSHGGNILKRMRLFVSGLIHQANAFQMPIELIFVEWNPPADRPPLHEVLPKPAPGDLLTLRYITVPAALHQRYRRRVEIPLFQMIAKNVGIRRAKHPWILATNIDLIFSDPLCAIMARGDLDPGAYYRANRVDIPDGIDESMTLAEHSIGPPSTSSASMAGIPATNSWTPASMASRNSAPFRDGSPIRWGSATA